MASICDLPGGSGSSGNPMVMFHTTYSVLTERDGSRSEGLNSGHSGGDSSCPANHQNHALVSNGCFYRKKRIIECFSFWEKFTRRSILDLSNAGVEPRYPIAIHGHFGLHCSHRRSGRSAKTGLRKTFHPRGLRSCNRSSCRGSATEIYALEHAFWSASLDFHCRGTAMDWGKVSIYTP